MSVADFSTPMLVTCLCAQWCGSCRDYRATFDAAAILFPEHRFVWIDIEDQADLVDPVDVDNFPTLLIAAGTEPLFFGPLTPQPETLARLVRACASGAGGPRPSDAAVATLVARLQAPPVAR